MSQEPSPSDEATEHTASPPPPRTRREGNDSLWKRARRTLGTNSLAFLQPQSRPTGTTASGTGPAAPSKRREQVRHAQRTHRQRTQNYIKTLESEVVRLRESETRLVRERDKLQGQIESLKRTLVANAVPLPVGTEEVTLSQPQATSFSDFDMPATVSYSTDNLDHQRLHVNFPRPNPSDGLGYPTQTYPMTTSYGHESNASPDLPNDFSFDSLNVSSVDTALLQEKRFSSIDTIETAIDFVLALEHPCMPHILYGDPEGTEPANHMMMVSTPLIARAPAVPHPNQSWTTSGAIIKELLNLSSSINLDGEITPVEAWHRLHSHPDFWRLNRNDINKLKTELSSSVRCCGFGAVLDEAVFLGAVHRALASAGSA